MDTAHFTVAKLIAPAPPQAGREENLIMINPSKEIAIIQEIL